MNNFFSDRNYKIFIILFGFFLCILGITPVAEHWVGIGYELMSKRSLLEAFTPLFLPEGVVYALRPLAFTLYKFLLTSFNLQSTLVHLLKGAMIIPFGYAIYIFLCNFGRKNVAFAAAVASMLLSSVLYSNWYMYEFDIFGVSMIFFSINGLLKFDANGKKINFLFFIIFALLAATTKETTAAFFLFFLLCCYLYLIIAKRGIKKLHILAAVLYSLFLVCLFSPMTKLPAYMGSLPQLKPSFLFVANHNITQLYYFISAAGVTIILYGVLNTCLWGRNVRITPAILCILAIPLFLFPVTTFYSHYEAIFLSPFFPSVIYAYFLIASLIILLLKRNTAAEIKFCSAVILGALAAGTLAPLLLSFSRDDVSSRIYIVSAPLLIYITLYSLKIIYEKLNISSQYNSTVVKIQNQKFKIQSPKIILFLVTIMFLYHFAANAYNFTVEFKARMLTEYITKKNLTAQPLDNSYIFYNNFPFQLGKQELELISSKYFSSTFFTLIDSVNAHDDIKITKDKMCYFSRLPGENVERIYFYFLSPKAIINESKKQSSDGRKQKNRETEKRKNGKTEEQRIAKIFEGNFNWTEKEGAYAFLKPSRRTNDSWDYGAIKNHKKTIFTKESTVEKFLNADGKKLFDYHIKYFQIPSSLNDIAARIFYKIPIVETYNYVGKIYSIDKEVLSCNYISRFSDIDIFKSRKSQQLERFENILSKREKDIPLRLTLAEKYLEKGKMRQAESHFLKVLQIIPQNETALMNIAKIYLKYGKKQRAIKNLQEIILLNPQNIEAYHMLGEMYLEMNNLAEAGQIFRKVLQILPDDPLSPLAIAVINSRKGSKKNIDFYLVGEQLSKDVVSPLTLYRMGNMYIELGLYNEAELSFLKIKNLAKDSSLCDIGLYKLAAVQGEDKDKIFFYLKKAIVSGGEGTLDAIIYLATEYVKIGKLTEAEILLLNVIGKAPDYFLANLLLAEVYQKELRVYESMKIIPRLIDINRKCIECRVILGQLYTILGAYKETRRQYTMALELAPNNSDITAKLEYIDRIIQQRTYNRTQNTDFQYKGTKAQRHKGIEELANGEWRMANKNFNNHQPSAINFQNTEHRQNKFLSPKDTKNNNSIFAKIQNMKNNAKKEIENGNIQNAIDILENAKKITPQDIEVRLELALAYIQYGVFGKAKKELDYLKERKIESPGIYFGLSFFYEKKDDIENAVKMMKKAVELDKENENLRAKLNSLYIKAGKE